MAKDLYDFPADISFRDAANVALRSGFQMTMDNAPATRSGVKRAIPTPEEVEALHDMRVGTRRLRAALSVFARALSRDDYRVIATGVADITDALGAVRDLDVQLEYLRELVTTLPENEAYGIGRLIERLTKQRDKERRLLIKALDQLLKGKFEKRFLKALETMTKKGEA